MCRLPLPLPTPSLRAAARELCCRRIQEQDAWARNQCAQQQRQKQQRAGAEGAEGAASSSGGGSGGKAVDPRFWQVGAGFCAGGGGVRLDGTFIDF